MNTDEFSNQFDALISAYAKLFDKNINTLDYLSSILLFDEYEKSVFLTEALEIFVISCYSGEKFSGHAFEVTEEDRRALSSLIKTSEIESTDQLNITPISSDSQFFRLPNNLLFITYEACDFSSDDSCIDNHEASVIPITQDEFHRIKNNPFRGATKDRVLRLDAGKNVVELVSKHKINKYKVRYLMKPSPIILVDLPNDLSINGMQITSDCRLPEFTHKRILDLAVQLALQSRSIGLNSK